MELFPLPSIKPQSLGIRALCLNQNVTGNRLGPEIDWGRFYSLFNSKRPAPSPHSHTPILDTAKCIMNRRDPNLTIRPQSYQSYWIVCVTLVTERSVIHRRGELLNFKM